MALTQAGRLDYFGQNVELALGLAPTVSAGVVGLTQMVCHDAGVAERLAALAPPGIARPPALMMALHIWSMSHGVASLFARGDAARRKLPMSAEDLLEAEVLIYLRGLGFPTDRRKPVEDQKPAGAAAPSGAPSGPWGTRST